MIDFSIPIPNMGFIHQDVGSKTRVEAELVATLRCNLVSVWFSTQMFVLSLGAIG